jgi:hypothetical protein
MAKEVVRVEKLVKTREEYMLSLENESIMLRREIKDVKFHNEKSGYTGFVGGLTKLRESRERSTSNNRGGTTSALSGLSPGLNLSSHNSAKPVKQERECDEKPQKDYKQERKMVDYSRY